MSVVTAQMVKELREMTLAGMSDCKKALDATSGDMEKAVIFLREKGLAQAAKKADRAASEGVVATVVKDSTQGFLVEVNCETDFVTKNEGFQKFVSSLQAIIEKVSPANLEDLLALSLEGSHTVKEATTQLVATIGENINVRRFAQLGNGQNHVGSYVHGGGKIGVLVELSAPNIQPHVADTRLAEVSKDVALQVAAMKPQFLDEASIPADLLKTEENIIRNKFKDKPEAALAKIVPSSLKTLFKEICLNDQVFVKDDSKSVASYVAECGKKIGLEGLHISSFMSFELGQGVEKKSEDFAAEVAATVASAKAN